MIWTEKRPKSPNANLVELERGSWAARVRLKLPDGRAFERERTCQTKTEARRLRDEMYAAFNTLALDIITAESVPDVPEREPLTLKVLAEKCRDEWWPAKGRSPDISDQFYQKIQTYCYPVLGEDRLISTITPDDWDAILISLHGVVTERYGPLSSSTIRKVKACLSSALSCAVTRKYLDLNPIKGLPYNPNPLAEADRMGKDAESLTDEDAPAKRMLSDAKAKQILAKSKGTLIYPMVVLQLGFGLRIAEALAVRWSDFDSDTGELKIRYQVKRRKNMRTSEGLVKTKSILERVAILKSKSGKRDIFPFDDAVELLKSIQRKGDHSLLCPNERGGLMEPRNAQRLYTSIVEALELPGDKPTTHSLRSWRLSSWANAGLPPSQLQRLAGHSRIETTMKFYVRSDTASLKQWISERGMFAFALVTPPVHAQAPQESASLLAGE